MSISRCNCAGFRILLGLALLITTWMTLTPQPLSLPDAPMADKWAHLLTFAVLAFLVDASWPEQGFDIRKWVALIGYGILIELLQTQVPNRFFSVGDIVANAAGVAVYAVAVLRLLRATCLR